MLAKKYILSHHLPKDYKRCLKFRINKKAYFICSRCFGLYLGFFIFLVLFYIFQIPSFTFILYLFPIPALVDWSMYRFNIYQGTNSSRIITGFLLGITYAGLLHTFIKNPLDFNFWFVVSIYLIIGTLIFKLTNKAGGRRSA
jgi:uncharacterized membrane protein